MASSIDCSGMVWCIPPSGARYPDRDRGVVSGQSDFGLPGGWRRSATPTRPAARRCRHDLQGLQFRHRAHRRSSWISATAHDPAMGVPLDHCGALMDVEPMVREHKKKRHVPRHRGPDPSTPPRRHRVQLHAQVRPDPPAAAHSLADRHLHCAWTVVTDDAHPEPAPVPGSRGHRAPASAARPWRWPDRRRRRGPGPTTPAPALPDLDSLRPLPGRPRASPTRSRLQMHLLDLLTLAVAERTETDDELVPIRLQAARRGRQWC